MASSSRSAFSSTTQHRRRRLGTGKSVPIRRYSQPSFSATDIGAGSKPWRRRDGPTRSDCTGRIHCNSTPECGNLLKRPAASYTDSSRPSTRASRWDSSVKAKAESIGRASPRNVEARFTDATNSAHACLNSERSPSTSEHQNIHRWRNGRSVAADVDPDFLRNRRSRSPSSAEEKIAS